jgi:GTP-binding protein Era
VTESRSGRPDPTSSSSGETASTRAPAPRAGFVAILGPPNAGKSTLLNRLLGQKLAIVTAKPQTTRSRILGIHNRRGAQILLVDTPGLHDSTRPLNMALNEAVAEATRDCDLALLLVDRTRGWTPIHQELCAKLGAAGTPFLTVGTKCDMETPRAAIWPPPEPAGACAQLEVSALTGDGIEALLQEIVGRLPESPPLYPEDALTDRPLRWLAGELVREAAFEALGQELPYSTAVEVVRFDESRGDLVRIDANLLVERNSQKRIAVGTGGEMVKRIGTRARRQIEKLLGQRVHLQLFVKVDPRWLKSAKRLKGLGYR